MNDSYRKGSYRSRLYANYGKSFQGAGDIFDEGAARRWGSARKWHLRRWLPENCSARIVDLACGDGRLLYFLRSRGYCNIAGVDISADQVALARQVVPDVTLGNVVEYLEDNPGKFDLITAFDIVEHFYKDEVLRFLDAAFSALRPGGRLILQTPNADGPWGSQYRYGDFTHEIAFNAKAIKGLLGVVGFVNVGVRECEPPPLKHSILSSVRFILWQAIRMVLMAYNLVETGSVGDRVFTRVFLATGMRPKE